MAIHFQKEMDDLKKHILSLCALVEKYVLAAARAIEEQDADAAREVIAKDIEIDRQEVMIEEEALKILALYQPVATDLRFLVSVIKINNDLERIGDLAVNIAERAVWLSCCETAAERIDFRGMCDKVLAMLRNSLDALVNWNIEQARAVCAADDEVDAMNREMYETIKAALRKSHEEVECLVHLLGVSRSLERIADHATNIAEDVIYMIGGEIVRHKAEEFQETQSERGPNHGKSATDSDRRG